MSKVHIWKQCIHVDDGTDGLGSEQEMHRADVGVFKPEEEKTRIKVVIIKRTVCQTTLEE